ncbi:MAG: TIGR03067 domain-containing protein [Planctomycetes bacterium]|nr:TIGR03067 domain-containing protein [Planctomycetota bacterium]
MHRIAALSAMLILTATTLSGGTEDFKRMEGTWSGEVVEAEGKPASDDFNSVQLKLVVKGETYTIYANDKQLTTGTFKLDSSTKPKVIDATPKDGPYKDKVQPGIYEFKGEDLRVVFGEPGQVRPKEFKTREGTKDALIVYKRLKDAKK